MIVQFWAGDALPDRRIQAPEIPTPAGLFICQGVTVRTVSPRLLNGGCRCGAIRYTVTDAFEYGANCHCSGCRRATGSAFKPFVRIRREELQITAGESDVAMFGEGNGGDARCARCGCFLYSVVDDGLYAHVTLGSLFDTPTRLPNHHIFVGSKADWEEIRDELPQFDEYAH
jgi:hypothetical protein